MTEAECRAEIRKFFMELYPACTVIYSYPGNAARPPAPYVVLDFDAADSSQIDEYVDDGILQQTWYMSMPFSAELVAQSKVVHGGGVKKALLSTAVDDLAQSIRFFQSSYAEDKMRLLNISVTATGNPEQIHNSVSGVERARCSFSVDFVQNTKEYAALLDGRPGLYRRIQGLCPVAQSYHGDGGRSENHLWFDGKGGRHP